MSTIIAIIIAAVFGLWGYHKRLYPMWAFLFNVLVAAYLSIVLTPAILEIKAVGEMTGFLGTWTNAAILLAIFGVYLALSQLLSFYYLTNTYCVSFPRLVDDFGGAFLGFAGGYITANILLFALAVSPLNEHALTQKFIPDNDGRAIIKACRYISSFSLQGIDDDLVKAVEKIKASPLMAKPAEQKTPPVEDSNKPALAAKEKPDSNQIVIVDPNINASQGVTKKQEPIELKNLKIIPADTNKILDANTNTKTNTQTEPAEIIVPVEKNVELRRNNRATEHRLQNPLQ